MIDYGKAVNIADLIEVAKSAESKFQEMPWFRGHSNSEWPLVPSAHRRHPILETQFAQQFRLRAPPMSQQCPAHADTAAWLPLMRHYGLPTRLLDWSESILVAAYFAANDSSEHDRTVWVLSPSGLNSTSIGRFIPFLVSERVKPLVDAAFLANTGTANQTCLATAAPRIDKRMVAQLGNYTIHGARTPLELHSQADQFLGRIHIPHAAAKNIIRELSLAGIRPSVLFPDLGNLAQEISEYRALDPDGNDLGDHE